MEGGPTIRRVAPDGGGLFTIEQRRSRRSPRGHLFHACPEPVGVVFVDPRRVGAGSRRPVPRRKLEQPRSRERGPLPGADRRTRPPRAIPPLDGEGRVLSLSLPWKR